MKYFLVTIALIQVVTLMLFFGAVSYRHEIATTLWERWHREEVALIDPDNAELHFTIAEYFFNKGSYDIALAEKYYRRAIALEPGHLLAHYQLGRILFIQGKFGSALAEIDEVLRVDPEYEKAYYMLGLINGYAGDLDQAIYGFSEFIKRDDFNWAGHNDLAWIYFKKGDYQKTKEVAAMGVKNAPYNPWINNIYGMALLNLGETEAARDALTVALRESEKMIPEDWGKSYPGNDPAVYAKGLEETRTVIRHNLALLDK